MDKLIISTFNIVFIVLFVLSVALLIVTSILLKNKSQRIREIVLASFMITGFVIYWIYKYSISIDTDYAQIKLAAGTGDGTFYWWGELPLHLCNINLILVPIGVLVKNKNLKAFCFFTGPLGALLGLLMPAKGFSGYSLLLPRVCGYYTTHFMVLIGCIAILTFGLYKPKLKDVINVLVMSVIIDSTIFGFNMILRLTHTYDYANYFYNVTSEGISALGIFYNLIPVPLLYHITIYALFGIYVFGLIAFINFIYKLKNK